MTFRAVLARSFLAFTLACGVAAPAMAQHVVTDNEAGKLTLDALTATPAPVVRRVAYHTLSRRSAYLPAAARARMRTGRAVRETSWHKSTHATGTVSHLAAHHRTRRG